MNNGMMMDVDPLSSYEAQYEYPLPPPHYYQPPPPIAPYTYKDVQPPNYLQDQYQTLPEPTETSYPQNPYDEPSNEINPTENVEEEDIKPDIVPPTETKRKKAKGKTSNYWNKKITDKDFAFYGCSVCNIAYTDLQKLDQHVLIHTNRLTSYDLRLINLKKRKRLKKAKKKEKKNSKVKQECDIDIKPEDGYIGTEKATDFTDKPKESNDKNCSDLKKIAENNENISENNENNPVNSKNDNQNHVNVYKCFGCNKQFALSYYLRIHVRSHTDEKPYTCAECGQRFITASKLGRHTKRIHLAVRHQCRICFKVFSRFELLVKHFDSKHPDDKLEGEPYDYNVILPYLKELEEQLKQEGDKKPKVEDSWGLPGGNPSGGPGGNPSGGPGGNPSGGPGSGDPSGRAADVAKDENLFVPKKEDKVTLPINIEFYDETKDVESSTTANGNDVKVDFEVKTIKLEVDDKDDRGRGFDDDHSFQDDPADDVKDEDPGSDEEYIPSQTWVRPHSPIVRKRRRKNPPTKCKVCNKRVDGNKMEEHLKTHAEPKVDIKPKTEPGPDTAKEKTNKPEELSEPDFGNDDGGSDEEYFPSETWVRSPSPLPEPSEHPKRRGKTTCEICNKQLCSKTYLAVHMRTHTGEKPFSCYICGRGFITASKMHRHVLTHDESWEGKDRIKPEDETKVKVETDTEGNEIEVKPDKASLDKSKTKLLLSKKKKTFFEKKGKECKKWTHVCEFCNQKFLHLETLQVHKKSHKDTDSMICYYCLEPHPDAESLRAHEATHVGPKPYLCTFCGHQYTNRGPMVYHRKRCQGAQAKGKTEGKQNLCEFCNKGYSSHSKLQRHLASHSVSQYTLRFECPVCAHMFHTRYHTRMHLRSHIKEGLILEENRNAVLAMVLQNARKIPKTPEVCAPTTSLPDSTGDERSRICNICGQIFQHFYYLEEHLKTHGSKLALEDFDEEEEKKHTCQVCSKSFKLPYYLKLHSYTHTKEKPYICQQCGKGFITKGKLKRHLETHQGLKKYQCHICYKFFTRPSYLRIHVRTIHGTQDYNFRDYGVGVPIGTLGQQ